MPCEPPSVPTTRPTSRSLHRESDYPSRVHLIPALLLSDYSSQVQPTLALASSILTTLHLAAPFPSFIRLLQTAQDAAMTDYSTPYTSCSEPLLLNID